MDGLYDEAVDLIRLSVFTDGKEVREITTLTDLRESKNPLLVAFEADNDIQQMQICSANIGMIRTYQKRYAAKAGGDDE